MLFRSGGKLEYKHTKVIFADGADIYYVWMNHLFRDDEASLGELRKGAIFIPTEEIRPVVPNNVTTAPDPLPSNSYVKYPSLLYHTTGCLTVKNLLLQEALVCENFIQSAHVNLAKYYGCVVESGRIAGLRFAKYAKTLDQRVAEPQGFQFDEMEGWLSGIKQGIDHIHSLGLVHNDINPRNIMFARMTTIPPFLSTSIHAVGTGKRWRQEGN